MLEIKAILSFPQIFKVISEPGDMTRYDFLVIKNYDEYIIAPFESTFVFPQRLNIWDIKKGGDDYIESISSKYKCNWHTTNTVVQAILEIENKYSGDNR